MVIKNVPGNCLMLNSFPHVVYKSTLGLHNNASDTYLFAKRLHGERSECVQRNIIVNYYILTSKSFVQQNPKEFKFYKSINEHRHTCYFNCLVSTDSRFVT